MKKILKKIINKKILATWTGGLDSTALVYLLIKEYNCTVIPYFINRGQRNYMKEKEAILYYSDKIKREYKDKLENLREIIVDIPPKFFKEKFRGNIHIFDLRNSDILNQGLRLAACEEIAFITTGSNVGDTFKDNSKAFYKIKNKESRTAIPEKNILIVAPFLELNWGKDEMVKWASENDFDLSDSWSCWHDNEKQCGECPPCMRRKEAYVKYDLEDKTQYLK